MKLPTVMMLCLCISAALFSQRNDLLFTNGQLIDDTRYKDIEKSPYQFKDWVLGNITAKNSEEPIEEVLLNYNGYSKRFEARKGNRFIELDEVWYANITIPSKSMTFNVGIHPSFPNRFMRVLYEGINVKLVQDFVVSKQTREKKLYGKVNMVSEFIKRPTYYLIKNNKATILKLKKKTILKSLDNDKQVIAFIKKQGLNMKEERDVVQVLRFYEDLYSKKKELVKNPDSTQKLQQ